MPLPRILGPAPGRLEGDYSRQRRRRRPPALTPTSLLRPAALSLLLATLALPTQSQVVTPLGGPSIYTSSVSYCSPPRAILVNRFSLSYFKRNESLSFDVIAGSTVDNLNVTIDLVLNAYGIKAVDLDINLCTLFGGALCPLPKYEFNGSASYVLPEEVGKKIPNVAYIVPDIEATARVQLTSIDSGAEVACLQTTLSNGKTAHLPGVVVALTLLLLIPFLLSLLIPYLPLRLTVPPSLFVLPSNPPLALSYHLSHIVHHLLIPFYQTVTLSTTLAVLHPLVYQSYAANFAWAVGMVGNRPWGDSVDGTRTSTGGQPTPGSKEAMKEDQEGGARGAQFVPITVTSGRRLGFLGGGGTSGSEAMRRRRGSAVVSETASSSRTRRDPFDLDLSVPGLEGHGRLTLSDRLIPRHPSSSDSGSTLHRRQATGQADVPPTANIPIVNPANTETVEISPGMEQWGHRLGVYHADIFGVVLVTWVIVAVCALALGVLCVVLGRVFGKRKRRRLGRKGVLDDKGASLEGREETKEEHRARRVGAYKAFLSGLGLRLFSAAALPMLAFSFYQLTVHDSWLFTLLAVLCILAILLVQLSIIWRLLSHATSRPPLQRWTSLKARFLPSWARTHPRSTATDADHSFDGSTTIAIGANGAGGRLYSDYQVIRTWSVLVGAYRPHYWWWLIVAYVADFIRAGFVGFGQRNGYAQTVGLVLLELLILIAMAVLRPYVGGTAGIRWMAYVIQLGRAAVWGLMIPMVESLDKSPIFRVVFAVIMAIVIAVLVVLLLLMMIVTGLRILWRLARPEKSRRALEQARDAEKAEKVDADEAASRNVPPFGATEDLKGHEGPAGVGGEDGRRYSGSTLGRGGLGSKQSSRTGTPTFWKPFGGSKLRQEQ